MSERISVRQVDVLVIGGGPAGLAVARAVAAPGRVAAPGVGVRVEVLEREETAGGVPRHCAHRGFGPWGALTGPASAARGVAAALAAGATVRTGVTVTGWAGPRTVRTTSPHGLEEITARAVVIATGARERPRAARLVAGTRPAGVLTTGELQQTVHLYGRRAGDRAVVVGAEPVGYAALDTLRRAGTRCVAITTHLAQAPAPWHRTAPSRLHHGVPLLTGTTVTEILGHGRVTGVRVTRAESGRTAHLPCDTVVFSGDFVPEWELGRRAGLSPAGGFRTTEPGVFAVGNAVGRVRSARAVTREGALAARAVRGCLSPSGV
ncbi:NAD(P)/FAD-dependent oxidoreductase [Streptomyces sp. NPDC059009]|uniref:NAD(P)/FAD-dependent oxidoreductase n=1 Tax=Streptomyces sp. NPDC059009 TaxID=3346694 RepID=UPI0036860F8C